MFCIHCGEPARGNFCGSCGTRIQPGGNEASSESPSTRDWTQESRYEVLIQIPQVRDRIAVAAKNATASLSGEEFLQWAEKALAGPLAGVPISKLAKLAQPFYAKWGIKTAKGRSATFAAPVGSVLVDVLCSLAASGQKIRSATQTEKGCRLEAILPSDFRSFEGDIVILVEQCDSGTCVEAVTQISGQIFDWGKSQQCLEALFGHLSARKAA